MPQNTVNNDELENAMVATSQAVYRQTRQNRPANTTNNYGGYGRKFQVCMLCLKQTFEKSPNSFFFFFF
jgi:hypothetical protein